MNIDFATIILHMAMEADAKALAKEDNIKVLLYAVNDIEDVSFANSVIKIRQFKPVLKRDPNAVFSMTIPEQMQRAIVIAEATRKRVTIVTGKSMLITIDP